MPELPEVETIRRQLEEWIVGQKILEVEVLFGKSFTGDTREIIGKKIVGVFRRAKIIAIELDGNLKLVIHLKMSGQLIFSKQNERSKFARVAITLDKGYLFFNDVRKFGWMKIMTDQDFIKNVAKVGPEPFSKEFTVEYLTEICGKWGRPIKLLLLDQEKIAGIGNIYASEALWCAQISPMKRARDLKIEKLRDLHRCILEVLKMGIKHQGSSAKDETYVNAFGEKGTAQEHFKVYQKQGEDCPRCGKTITKSMLGGRGTYFCPKCQK